MINAIENNIEKLRGKKIAVIGATGLVGKEMIEIFDHYRLLKECIELYASSDSAGCRINFNDNGHYESMTIKDVEEIDFSQYDIALFSAGSEVSKEYAPKAVKKGCTVIDNTSYFRMDKGVPLIVPEINMNKAKGAKLIANPNCSTIQVVMPLKPLHDEYGLKEVVMSTYQSVSGAGRKGVETFEEEINEYRKCEAFYEPYDEEDSPFPVGILFNLVPKIGDFADLDYTQEEWKMINETKKILELPNIDVTATCVRVPVFVGHSVAVFAKFEKEIDDIEKVKKILNNFEGITVKDEKLKEYVVPRNCEDKENMNEVLVSRIRKHPTIKNGLSFWCVANNLRKGAALNAIQIASLLD